MTSIGETLRRERLRRGWNLDQVAAETKISVHLLEAIEADQFDRLPGGVFARNFVRQYARLLHIDEEEILAAFRHQFEGPAEAPPPPEPAPHVSGMTPLGALRDRLGPGTSLSAFMGLVLVILACAAVYSLWQKARRPAPSPEPVAAVVAKPQPPVATQPAEAPKPEFRPAEISENGAIRVPEPAASKPSATVPAVAVAPGEPSAVRVAFTALEPVWVSIKSDGERKYSGTLGGQQTREFDAAQKMTVLVGNAGGLDLSLNGKPLGPIGPKGEIRLLVLTPEGAHVVPRTPRTSEDSTAPTEPVSATERP